MICFGILEGFCGNVFFTYTTEEEASQRKKEGCSHRVKRELERAGSFFCNRCLENKENYLEE
jgi:hypothetical protein